MSGRSGNPDLRGAAGGAKRDSFFEGLSAAIAIALHIFKLQERVNVGKRKERVELVRVLSTCLLGRYEMTA
jgi:hypothetical protein